ncbi:MULTISPECIES: 4-hydroxy-tetrahydrodipicolinate reductase [unclassified Haladaptatus]|uniref:4-hydroxy-tetrahydrodipicolinate reductase n=1 Tax=unclassified Haladaptatus TaxID=2622732 RepID=UPI00209C5A21|nr:MULTISPECIES: 4-hydroxy-tetrahydrodipicolinate reductase [unclassified Haladaptatus]MCO8244478.1 4-hydroxy-tetrahydrodipicolinate reductase [Haladaptatus sp. AB643]MCO8253900.1 4-hydroxy-tetrahydrodipicolinate reductase [Haladaptatus sp. AB618]
MTRVLVLGATGRMGRSVIAEASARDDVHVVAGVGRESGEIDGVPVEPADALGSVLSEYDPDVLIDFSVPDASVEFVTECADAGVPCVVGTTGFTEDDEVALREASEHAPVLVASNFSRGVQALLRAVEGAVSDLPGYDVELTETHHNGKRDAPSGTAKTVLDRITAAGGPEERVHGREGDAPRQENEIGVHARRAGGIAGEHEVLLANDHEELRLAHRAADRAVFADGALDAAVWLAGRTPGWYGFDEVITA